MVAESKDLCCPGLQMLYSWPRPNAQAMSNAFSAKTHCWMWVCTKTKFALPLNCPWHILFGGNNHTLESEWNNFSRSFILVFNWRRPVDCWKFDLAWARQLYTYVHVMKGSDNLHHFHEEILLEHTTVKECVDQSSDIFAVKKSYWRK